MKNLFFFSSSFVVVKGGDCIVPSWVCCECHMLLGGGSTLLSFLFFFPSRCAFYPLSREVKCLFGASSLVNGLHSARALIAFPVPHFCFFFFS